MAETVIDTMVVKLMGDGMSYVRMLQDAQRATLAATNTIKKQLDTIGSSFKSFGAGLTSLGAKYSAAITAPLTALAGVAVRDAMQFEAALSRMEGLVGLNKQEIAGFSEEIKKLAVVTGKMPLELASAMENITSSGIKGKDALETLTVTSKAAAGGLGEVRSVSDTVTSAMNAYGVANLSATRATDILVAAVREGKAEADSFAPVLGNVLPIANEMGISFEEAAGSIAYLTLATGSASTAATQYQNILAQTIKLNEKNDSGKVLKQAGVDIKQFQADVADKGLLDSLMKLKDTLAGKGLTLKDAFPDVQAMTAALQLTGANAKKAKEVIDNVGKAGGSVDLAFGAASQTKAFKFNQAMAEGKVILLELGDMFSEVMAKLMGWATSGIELWKGLTDGSKKLVVNTLAFAAALGPVLVGSGVLVTLVGSLISGAGMLVGAFGGLVSVLGTIASVSVAAFGFLFSVPGAIAAFTAMVTYSIAEHYKFFDVITNGWAKLKEYIGPAIQGIVDAVSNGDLEKAFKIGWTQIELGWLDFTDYIQSAWDDCLNYVRRSWQEVSNDIANVMADHPLVQQFLGIKPEDVTEFKKQLAGIHAEQMTALSPIGHEANPNTEAKRKELQDLIGFGGVGGGGDFGDEEALPPPIKALIPENKPDLGLTIPAEQTKKIHVEIDFKTVGAGSGAHLDLLSEFFSGRPAITKKAKVEDDKDSYERMSAKLWATPTAREIADQGGVTRSIPQEPDKTWAKGLTEDQAMQRDNHERERAHFARNKGTYSYEETLSETRRMDAQEQGLRHQIADSKQGAGAGNSFEKMETALNQLVVIGNKELEKDTATLTPAGLGQ